MAPPIRMRVGELGEAVDDADLVGHLGAADRHHERVLGRRQQLARRPPARPPAAARPRRAAGAPRPRWRRARGARRRTRRSRTGRPAPPARPPTPGRCSPRAGRSAGSRAAARRGPVARRRRTPRGSPSSSASRAATGRQRQLRLGLALGPAEVRADDHLRRRARAAADGRQRRPDAGVVGDPRRRRSGTFRSARTSTRLPVDRAGRATVRHHGPTLCDQVDQPARVAPLVVVPGDDLDQVAVHHRRAASRRSS